MDIELKSIISTRGDAIKFNSYMTETSWLSNFYKLSNPILLNDKGYYTAEAFYQAMKSENLHERKNFQGDKITGSEAKKMGMNITVRENWEEYKFEVMKFAIEQKFENNPDLKEKLLKTRGRQLVEWNDWGDKVWGITSDDNKGANALGKIIESYRNKIIHISPI